MPQVAPQLVSARSFNSTAVNVSWTAIDQTREKVRGKLIGHRVIFSSTFHIFFYSNEERQKVSGVSTF